MMDKIECILCGLTSDKSQNIVEHMTNQHRIAKDMNYVLAGCVMTKEEREDICNIFRPVIKDLSNQKLEVVEQASNKTTIGETKDTEENTFKETDDLLPCYNVAMISEEGDQSFVPGHKRVCIDVKKKEQDGLKKKMEADRLKKGQKAKRTIVGKFILDSNLPDYFKEHPSLIMRWNGEESTLIEDTNLSGGWKIKLERRTSGKHGRHFVTPDRKYVIRTIEGVLEYLKHNDVEHDDIEKLFETFLKMKTNRKRNKYSGPVETKPQTKEDSRTKTKQKYKGNNKRQSKAKLNDKLVKQIYENRKRKWKTCEKTGTPSKRQKIKHNSKRRTENIASKPTKTDVEDAQSEYPCDQCDYKDTNLMILVIHKRKLHKLK